MDARPCRAPFPPAVAAAALLSADEVARATGQPVTATAPTGAGPMSVAWFRNAQSGAPTVSLVVTRGIPGQLIIRALRGNTALPGIGDEAYGRGNAAAARRGDVVVTVNLHEAAAGTDPGQLPRLLATAVSRLPGWAAPPTGTSA